MNFVLYFILRDVMVVPIEPNVYVVPGLDFSLPISFKLTSSLELC